MALSDNLQAKVLESDLPNIRQFSDGTIGYDVRYRIVSEDGNRFSPYSPIYRVIPNYEFVIPQNKTSSDIELVTGGPYVQIAWEPIIIKDRVTGSVIRNAVEYDIFLKWGQGEVAPDPVPIWSFQERVEGTTQAFIYPDQYELDDGSIVVSKPNRLSIEIYMRSINPSRDNDRLLVYKLDDQTV